MVSVQKRTSWSRDTYILGYPTKWRLYWQPGDHKCSNSALRPMTLRPALSGQFAFRNRSMIYTQYEANKSTVIDKKVVNTGMMSKNNFSKQA
ncbi:hypothetical protein D3C74_447920 [compost metagenome]